jgi:hypothetical protein
MRCICTANHEFTDSHLFVKFVNQRRSISIPHWIKLVWPFRRTPVSSAPERLQDWCALSIDGYEKFA